jgi:thiol-disulfide isomerase/thioredoxin
LPGLRPAAPAAARTLPSLAGASAWLNGPPIADASLSGRPVVLLLWSDTDPRALAALPVLDAWNHAWGPLGVKLVAVHEPEFAFAADSTVPAAIVRRLSLTLPVALDPAGRIAAALGGMTEGARLLVADERGAVVVDTVGTLEPGEEALRAWLARAMPDRQPPMRIAADLPANVRSVALGAGRVAAGPLAGVAAGSEQVFVAPMRYEEQGKPWLPVPVGAWQVTADGLTATRGGAANFVSIRYSADRAGVVVSPPPGASARVWILRDDQWPRAQDRGEDVVTDDRGAACIEVREARLYWFDRGTGERVIKLSPDAVGVTLHAFVFTGAR